MNRARYWAGWLLVAASGALAGPAVEVVDPVAKAATDAAALLAAMAAGKRSEVVHVDRSAEPAEVYVRLGHQDGVRAGQILLLFARGEAIQAGDEIIGYVEKPIGVAEVGRIQNEQLCVATVRRLLGEEAPSVGNAAYLRPVPGSLALASVLRTEDGRESLLGRQFADRLEGALGNTGRFTVVERQRLDALMAEHKLGLSDLFDPAKTAELGRQVQAQGVLLGTTTKGDGVVTIKVRVVDIQTGVQTASVEVLLPLTMDVADKYGRGTGVATSAPADHDATGPPPGHVPLFSLPVAQVLRGDEAQDPKQYAVDTSPDNRGFIGGRLWEDLVLVPDFSRYGLQYYFLLDRQYTFLEGTVGQLDGSNNRDITIPLVIEGDGRPLGRFDIPPPGDPPVYFSLPVTDVQTLTLSLGPHGSYWLTKHQVAFHRLQLTADEPAGKPEHAADARRRTVN